MQESFDPNPLAQLRQDRLYMVKVENQWCAPNSEYTLADLQGPGNVVSLWMALGNGAGPCLDGRLRVYYDGAPNASIDIDIGTLFATHWGAGAVYGSHSNEHVHVEINSQNYNTGFLLTYPMPYGSRIRVVYYNCGFAPGANIYSMVTYAPAPADAGYRLRQQGARWADQRVWRNAGDSTTLLDTSGGPGWVIYHSQVGGVDAHNLSWLERNFGFYVDGEQNPSILATGTEDWFDSAWYYNLWRDYPTSRHSYVGTMVPPQAPNAGGMVTDFMSKWGGVPFTSSVQMRALPEPACNTGDRLCWCILYYQ